VTGDSSSAERSGSRRVARNGVLNLVGNLCPIVVGIVAIPPTIQRLGVDAFGLLGLAWAILGYFTLFDLGLGRAVTKFIAESLGGRAQPSAASMMWTSIVLSAALATAGAMVIAVAAVPLVEHGLQIDPRLRDEARGVSLILAAGLPAVLISNIFKAVLEANQRFDLINLVKVPASAAMFALPAVGAAIGLRLPAIVLLLVLSRVATVISYAWICLTIDPSLRRVVVDMAVVRPLVTYGGWVTASNLLGPVLTYADRFVIGALMSTAAVAYYTAPYEIVTRLWIFPASIVAALFPAFTTAAAGRSQLQLRRFCRLSVGVLAVVMTPVVAVLAVFAHRILTWWLGAEFATHGTLVFQVLAFAVLVNSLTQVPFTLLQALNRADLPAKFYVCELVLYGPAVVLLVDRFGIDGAAYAWTARVLLDCALHFGTVIWLFPGAWSERLAPATLAVVPNAE
jgi:O-antigen/teichoic acid export membrane protein